MNYLLFLIKHPTLKQFIRFGATGTFAIIVRFLIVILLVEINHWNPLYANIIGFSLSFFVSFFGHRLWTFSGPQPKMSESLTAFSVIILSTFALNQAIFYLLLTKIHLPYVLALTMAIGITASLNFIINRHWAFRSTQLT